MKASNIFPIMFWAFAIVAPVAISLIAISFFPPDAEVPLHFNVNWEADGWGPAWTWVPISLVMAGANALMALSYAFSDALYDRGLVHGVSRKATRPFLCGIALFLVVAWAGITIFWMSKALPLM